MKIAVIGAGIIGVSTAYQIKLQHPYVHVVIIAKDFSPNTVSDVAAGFWEPYVSADTPKDLMSRWSKETYHHIMNLTNTSKEAGISGLTTSHGFTLYSYEDGEVPYWTNFVYDFRVMTKDEIRKRFPNHIKSGFVFTTVFAEGAKYIPYLSKKYKKLGGKFMQRKIETLSELAGVYDIVVNCTGYGSRFLVQDDRVVPVRGQIVKVKAPWVRDYMQCYNADGTCPYILPNQDCCILGGTTDESDNLKVNEEDKQWILKSTKELMPSLEHAEWLEDIVALRPSRSSVRIEREKLQIKTSDGKQSVLQVIHNYGHGGSGITIHWGCAREAAGLVTECMSDMVSKAAKL